MDGGQRSGDRPTWWLYDRESAVSLGDRAEDGWMGGRRRGTFAAIFNVKFEKKVEKYLITSGQSIQNKNGNYPTYLGVFNYSL